MVTGHVFICYSALSFDAAVRIRHAQSNADEAYILALFDCPQADSKRFERVFSVNAASHGTAEIKKPFIIASWFKEVLKSLSHIEAINAYIPHPFELPANHLAFSDPRVVRLELLPDGLLNYTSGHFFPSNQRQRLRYSTRVALRKLSAQLIGCRYQALRPGHLTQFEQLNYERCWTDNPQGYRSCRGNLTLLPQRPLAQEKEWPGPTAMVLDQELAPLVSKELALRLRQTLIKHLKQSGVKQVIYKGHPRGKNRSQQFLAAGLGVEDVTGPELAELLIPSRGVTHLFGFYSTPLLLAAQQVEHRLCVLPAPHAPGVKNQEQVTEYLHAFNRSGANVLAVE